MPFFALMTCGLCGGAFTGNPENVPSVDAEARTEAMRIVDQRWGYSLEEAPDAIAHAAEYDEEEQKLFDPARREPLCENCISVLNEVRALCGLSVWAIFPDSYGVAEGLPS